MVRSLTLYAFRIVAGFLLIAGSVVIIESAGRWLLDKTTLSEDIKTLLVSITESICAVVLYISFYRRVEKRKITELPVSGFSRMAFTGFAAGFFLQALTITVISLYGHYTFEKINPIRFLLPAFSMSFVAGVVAELIIRGIFFRILEEKLGTLITLIGMVILFAILHAGSHHANWLSVTSTSIQAGLLLSAAYLVHRNLWLPIFLHFSYDFAEPGIFGGINPGIHTDKSLFNALITGNNLISGGMNGPQNSIQSLVFCCAASAVLLYAAWLNKSFIPAPWLAKQQSD